MNTINDETIQDLFRSSGRYLFAISGVIISVPVLFYLLVVRSPVVELVYTFRITNETDYFLHGVQLGGDKEFWCDIPPKGRSRLFIKSIRSPIRGVCSNELPHVNVNICEDSTGNYSHVKTIIRPGSCISPERLNRISIFQIKPDALEVTTN